jgi:Domain of unknown function (DUF4331)
MKFSLHLLAVGALGFGLAACGGGSNSVHTTPVAPQTFTQIELLSRPAVKELFEKFVDHQTSNASEPYADTTLQTQIKGLTDALRPPKASVGSDYGAALASILYPNEMTADLSQSGNASYLGVETGGATGGKFGGRDLSDDVIDISLGAVFGGTLAALHVQPEDNEENTCLTTDHVAQNPSQAKTATFPYLHAPH